MSTISSARGSTARHCARATVVIASMALFSACATSGSAPDESRLAPATTTTVTIENQSWDHISVYMVTAAGQRVGLGRVEGNSVMTFSAQTVGALTAGAGTYFIARPLAGRTFRSETFMLPFRGRVIWSIQNQRSLSQVILR